MEFCRYDSLKTLQKTRPVITEFECRYYVNQILSGVRYLHERRFIHRDLKLANIFLTDRLKVKIGDFGLATQVFYEGELKETSCGTANFLAPEIVNRRGYSYPVDIWAIGCIMYYLLVGTAPFEANDVKSTYKRIVTCDLL